MSQAPSPHLAFIQRRMPGWLQSCTAQQRQQLERRLRDSHRASHRLRKQLARLQAPETFCRAQLDQALAHWFADRELPDVDQGWLWHVAQRRGMSWLEAAMLNFDEADQIRLYLRKGTTAATAIDTDRFVKTVRNLDLGGRYQAHVAELLDSRLTHQLQQDQDRAAFAAELTLALLRGRIDSRGATLGEAALAWAEQITLPDGSQRRLQCCYLALFDCALNGPLLISLQAHDETQPCLLYLPGHPSEPMRQYPSLAAMGQALTHMLWDDHERQFFVRYVSHGQQLQFALRLRETLFPRYPYPTLHCGTPVLEKGQQVSLITRLFPNPRHIWQETLDKNARLAWSASPWQQDCFAARTRTQLERKLQDAADIVVPTAKRDAQALWGRIEGWLQTGLNVLNIASLFIPGLAQVMLVVGGAQLVDEFLEGVHAANEEQADAALVHLFAVFENLAQFAALGAAGRFAEPIGPLHEWQRIGSGCGMATCQRSLRPGHGLRKLCQTPRVCIPGKAGSGGCTMAKRTPCSAKRKAAGAWRSAKATAINQGCLAMAMAAGCWSMSSPWPGAARRWSGGLARRVKAWKIPQWQMPCAAVATVTTLYAACCSITAHCPLCCSTPFKPSAPLPCR